MVIELFGDPFYANKPLTRMKALETETKITKTVRQIHEIDAMALRKDFLDGLLNAVSYAFHRANAYQDPAERISTFINELALFFPRDDDIEVSAIMKDDGD